MTKHITKTAIEVLAESISTIKVFYEEAETKSKDTGVFIEGVRRGKKLAVEDLAENIATGIEVVDPRFDRKRFLTLCGY